LRGRACRHFVARALDDLVTGIVKSAVMSPEHMKPVWRRESEFAQAFGMTPDEMVLHALKEGHHELSVFAGSHMFPIIPGPRASYAPSLLHGVWKPCSWRQSPPPPFSISLFPPSLPPCV
jgi:hypothetical protein